MTPVIYLFLITPLPITPYFLKIKNFVKFTKPISSDGVPFLGQNTTTINALEKSKGEPKRMNDLETPTTPPFQKLKKNYKNRCVSQ